MTNETPICFSITSNAKTKFKSVFQSDARTKIEKWNSNPFFKVKRKRKKKYEVQIRFSKLSENEKQKAKFKSVFQCHAKTKNVNGIWIPFSHAIEKRLAPRYTHYSDTLNLIAKFLYAVTWLRHSKKKRHLSFSKKHLVYDDCQLSYRVNWKPSLLTYNRLSSSLLAALWTSLAQNIQAG